MGLDPADGAKKSKIVWRVLRDGAYYALDPDPDGVLRSTVFPGLWLDQAAFWANDAARMLDTRQAGLASEERKEFGGRLRRGAG